MRIMVTYEDSGKTVKVMFMFLKWMVGTRIFAITVFLDTLSIFHKFSFIALQYLL